MAYTTVQKTLRSSDGTDIYTEASGDPKNPHVILVHGLSFSGAVFDDFCQREDVLGSLYVVRVDLRGHGRSGEAVTPEGHLSYLYADDYKAVVEAYGLRTPVHAGWSLGGTIASDVCAHLGVDALSGVFYLSSLISISDFSAGYLTPRITGILARLKDPVPALQTSTEFVDACLASGMPKPIPYHMRCMWLGMVAAHRPECSILATTREQNAQPIWNAIKTGLPICQCYGTADAVYLPRIFEDVVRAAGAKDVETVVIQGAGHTLIWDEPNTVAEALIGFAKRVWKGDQAGATRGEQKLRP
ncbi:Alpha/Beta hydrolase protein [Amylostereum chailletii]|nr:Alpha/Beta hydrolase protein [Amylostereum chailletii]